MWLLARSFNIRSKLVNYSLTRIDLELSDVGAGKSLQNLKGSCKTEGQVIFGKLYHAMILSELQDGTCLMFFQDFTCSCKSFQAKANIARSCKIFPRILLGI